MRIDSVPANADCRILVVDDNVDATLILSMSLRLKGFAVESAQSGPQALTISQSWQPDAVLLDISMPGMDGYETCERLREQPGSGDVLVIALTGYGQEEDRKRVRETGFDAHLVKPVNLSLLPDLLPQLIIEKKARLASE
ncbi:response regulator [Spirosoma radiotolerans]|uniref:response regulator n=1 Tax=Spirosoma radiotolerans TaxID=1379870 RepID=UPI0009E333FB|nr:response regulator [Spirosoma radiotolerans]